jgi:hypothetical protein
MILLPKEFEIDIAKLDKRFAKITSSNYNGVVKSGINFTISWKQEPSNQDLAAIELYWRDLTEQVYNTPTAEEQTVMLAKILEDAKNFGTALIVQFAMENVAMGITQAGKTRAVADYCYKLQYYLSTGSLYAAKEEIEDKLDELPEELAPFLTAQRLTIYLNKIKTYLNIPIT